MTREEFENSPENANMLYVGENRQRAFVVYSDKDKEIYCEVTGTDGVKTYDIYRYLRLLGNYIAIKATEEKSEIKQMEILVEARSAMVHFIENIKRITQDVELKKEYKYDGFILGIDSHIQMSKSELENKLLVSQLSTNENVQETNKNIAETNSNIVVTNRTTKRLLRWTTFFAMVAALVGVGSLKVSKMDYDRELSKDTKEEQLLMLHQQLRAADSQKHQMKYENDSLRNQVDSLKKRLKPRKK